MSEREREREREAVVGKRERERGESRREGWIEEPLVGIGLAAAVSNVSNADMGDYYCVITGICTPPATSSVAKLTTSVCTNTVSPFTKEKFFKVYPNPSQNISNIEFTMGSGEDVKIKVYDLIGNELMEQETQMSQGNSVEINLENYAEGMYIIYVEKNGVIYTDKLEKIK